MSFWTSTGINYAIPIHFSYVHVPNILQCKFISTQSTFEQYMRFYVTQKNQTLLASNNIYVIYVNITLSF